MTAPTFEIIGDGQLTDEAIEALAALLLSIGDAEVGAPQDAGSPAQIDPPPKGSKRMSPRETTRTLRLSQRETRR